MCVYDCVNVGAIVYILLWVGEYHCAYMAMWLWVLLCVYDYV